MEGQLEPFLRLTVILFMACSLLEMGLRVALREALTALGDWRFTGTCVVWGFVACPVLAVMLTWIVPLEPSHATGLLLLGMAPGAPLLPSVAARAGGAQAYVAAFLVIATVGVVVFMPVAVPLLVAGFTADAWDIAAPLIALIIVPLVVGVVLEAAVPLLADRLRPMVHLAATLATLQLVVLVTLAYGRDFVGAVGTYAIATLCAFVAITTMGVYAQTAGYPDGQRRVLALGLCTRNVGAAAAPLLGVTDRGAMVMVALAVPTTVVAALVASRWFGRRDPRRIP